MNIIVWVVSALLAIFYILAGTPKVLQSENVLQMFADWGYPIWFAVTIGVFEVAGGILLLVPRAAQYSAILLGLIMLGAIYTHLANGEGLQVLRPIIFLMLLSIVTWGRCKN